MTDDILKYVCICAFSAYFLNFIMCHITILVSLSKICYQGRFPENCCQYTPHNTEKKKRTWVVFCNFKDWSLIFLQSCQTMCNIFGLLYNQDQLYDNECVFWDARIAWVWDIKPGQSDVNCPVHYALGVPSFVLYPLTELYWPFIMMCVWQDIS